ncbi:increased DNA methylation 1-like [Magnolia sinica]|uniref:increased DNA methylation 1-like n=1 Tax=Magnolia sinica TaxID=86752 RepID=UPI002659BA88|nr:increased DNA methylation 1-like [Magnolia sinica]
MQVFPESVYFCPSCGCGLCGEGEYNNDGEIFVEKTILFCDQCERGYHVGCLRERGDEGLESCPEGNWFCGEKCSEIFFHLQNLLGKSNSAGIDGLSWTILRSNEKHGRNRNTSSIIEAMTKCKLRAARSMLRECFDRIIQPATKTDLITDVVFSKESAVPHLNYRGFYTMILEKGKKPISVATFRVRSDKVAEVPLVGTCIRSRRQGMCRLLMNSLQKVIFSVDLDTQLDIILANMGVQKLLLPVTAKLLQCWNTSFGFSVATNFDRFKMLEYPFLEFNDTIMCQKLLTRAVT